MKQFYLLFFLYFLVISIHAQQVDKPIHLKSGTLRLIKNIRQEKNVSRLLQTAGFKDRYYVLIQFGHLPDEKTKKELANKGIVLYGYLPQNAFMAEISNSIADETFKKYSIGNIYSIEPSSKIAEGLLQQLNESGFDPDKPIAIHFFGSLDRVNVIAEVTQAGAQIVATKIKPANVVFISASAAVVQKIALLPFVTYISREYLKDIPINYNNRAVHSLNSLSASLGRNLQGNGVTIGIGDNADISPHLDFSGRFINRFPLAPDLHGTHTAGTMAGAGILNPKYRGMAPGATIINQFFSDVLVNAPFNAADYNMVLTNNSYYSGLYGCAGEGDYNVLSNYVDQQMIDDPSLLHVFAAGNDGYFSCSPYKSSFATIKSGFQCGKNILTVGALNTYNYAIAGFSSRGPVDDGRLKPEIVAGGLGIASAAPGNSYKAASGTSMAAPTVTGTLALLYERFRQLNSGVNPPAALIKAIACNTAEDVGNTGPDFTYGFGSLNARNAVEAIENKQYFVHGITHGKTVSHTIPGVPAGAGHIKIMLYWNDPAAAPYATKTLVNNLDLSVTTSGAFTHRPLVLNPNSNSVENIAEEGVDNTNNIEQVVIKNPPPGDYVVTVSGTNIPSGNQEYVIVYQVVQPSVTIEYPFGEETWVPGEQETIRWSAYGNNTGSFTIEYSVNDGNSWTTITNNAPPTSRSYVWTVPNQPTGNALIKVTRNGTEYSDTTDHNFTILAQPSLTLANTCPGYVQLSWGSISSATAYEIMMLRGGKMEALARTVSSSYLLAGLHKDSTYWLSVRAIKGSAAGRPALAKSITPSGGSCPSPVYDHDFTPDLLSAPVTSRKNTGSQLGMLHPAVRIRNLGKLLSSGAFNISYQVNDGHIATENCTQVIPAASSYTYTFNTPFDFSEPGTYVIKIWVDYSKDKLHNNDTLIALVKQLRNDPLVLQPSYTESFESAGSQTYNYSTKGFDGLDRCDLLLSNSNGRARTFVNTAFVRTGTRAVTVDQKNFNDASSTDSLIVTFNLSNYSPGDQLWLDFYYWNHGIDFSLPGNQVWIRGSEIDAWIPVYTLRTEGTNDFSKYLAAPPINITETLTNAVPAQVVSSSFQIKFGQQGYTSANSVNPIGNLDDGFTFDDVTLTLAKNDVGIKRVVNPAVNICSLNNNESVSVLVKSYSASVLNNISIAYDVDGVAIFENIPSLAPGEELIYTFSQKANLAAYQSYTLKSWVHYPSDNYSNNDTLSHSFTTVPSIVSYPYLQGFEENNGYWYTSGKNSSWQWGVPVGKDIGKAANGKKAWVTNLAGNHNNDEWSYLYSPCFDVSGLQQPVLSFSHIFRTEDICSCDFHWVEYSTDGGISWIKFGAAGNGTNWYDDTTSQAWKKSNMRWHVSSYDIPPTAGVIRFRFVMKTDAGITYEGVGIDDVHVFDRKVIYNGIDITDGLTQNVGDTNWTHFEANGSRILSINPNGQNLGNTTVKLFVNTGQVRHNDYQYYLDRNIVIHSAVQPSKPVTIRFYFSNSEVSNLLNATGCAGCYNINDAYECGITQYSGKPEEENEKLHDNDNGLYRFIVPDNVTIVPYDNGYYAEYQVGGFSEFWINGGGPRKNLAIPQIVDSLTVSIGNGTGLVDWITQREVNTDKFVVEKDRGDNTFYDIGELPAAGSSTSVRRYQFTDRQLLWGLNHYRIRTVNKDGKMVRSDIAFINNDGNDHKIVDSFRVTKNNQTALLQWIALQQANVDKFIIERSMDDNIYIPFGEVDAAGIGVMGTQYHFTDNRPEWGLNYYRIKTLSSNGLYVYSPVRTIDFTGIKLVVYIYPNPVKKGIVYVNTTANCLHLELRDILGRIKVYAKGHGKQNELPLNYADKGVYFLTVVTEAGKRVEKIIIE